MFWIVHILTGIAFATKINSLLILAIVGITSHYILDMLPHWDGYFDNSYFNKSGKLKVLKKDLIIKSFDGILMIIMFITLFILKQPHLLFGGFLTILPDLVKLGYFTNLKNNKYYMGQLKHHARIQNDVKPLLGLSTQIIIILICLILIF